MNRVLNETERQIVTLHVISGFKHREIAELLEKPVGTVLWRPYTTRCLSSAECMRFAAYPPRYDTAMPEQIIAQNPNLQFPLKEGDRVLYFRQANLA